MSTLAAHRITAILERYRRINARLIVDAAARATDRHHYLRRVAAPAKREG